jgi:hypothetical protein
MSIKPGKLAGKRAGEENKNISKYFLVGQPLSNRLAQDDAHNERKTLCAT